MKILLLNRYDPNHPGAGGAERFSLEIMRRFVKDGHNVTWLASRAKQADPDEDLHGIKIIRKGTRLTVLFHAWNYYRKHSQDFDYVIDEMHALPFLTPLYVPSEKRVMLIHEIAGAIWRYMTPLPVAIVGSFVERLLLRLFYSKQPVLTVSQAGKQELMESGIPEGHITVIPEGVTVSDVTADKTERPSIVYFGGMRPLKRVEDQLVAIAILKKELPYLRFKILGRRKGKYYKKLKRIVAQLKLDDMVEFTGFLPIEERDKLVASAWTTLGTSVKEGWGLAVAEAAALGTPAVVYPSPGNSEAVIHLQTGLHTTEQTPKALAVAVRKILAEDEFRNEVAVNAAKVARALTWEKSYHAFNKAITANGSN